MGSVTLPRSAPQSPRGEEGQTAIATIEKRSNTLSTSPPHQSPTIEKRSSVPLPRSPPQSPKRGKKSRSMIVAGTCTSRRIQTPEKRRSMIVNNSTSKPPQHEKCRSLNNSIPVPVARPPNGEKKRSAILPTSPLDTISGSWLGKDAPISPTSPLPASNIPWKTGFYFILFLFLFFLFLMFRNKGNDE